MPKKRIITSIKIPTETKTYIHIRSTIICNKSYKLSTKKTRKECSPNDLPDVLGRHVLLLRLDEPELALVAVALRIELLPFSSLLLEPRLCLGRRRQHRVRGLRRWRRRNRRASGPRWRNLAAVPHGGNVRISTLKP